MSTPKPKSQPDPTSEGYGAFENGMPENTNPYASNTTDYDDWRDGWYEAMEDEAAKDDHDDHDD